MLEHLELTSVLGALKRRLPSRVIEDRFDGVPAQGNEFDWISIPANDTEQESNRSPKLAGMAVALVLAVVMSSFVSTPAVAHTTFTADDLSVTSNNGVLTSLSVAPAGDVHYDGLEQPPERFDLVVSIKPSGGSWEQLDEKSLNASGLEGTASYSFSSIDVLKETSLTTADLRAADGDSTSTELTVRVEATLVGAGPNGSDVTSTGTDTFAVTVTNEQSGAGVGGQANTNGG